MPQAPGAKPKRTPATRPAPTPAVHARGNQARLDAARRRRNRILIASGASLLVVVLIVALVILKPSKSTPSTVSATAPTAAEPLAPPSLVARLATIPASGLAAAATAAAGSGVGVPSPITDAPLTSGGKPEVLYIGAGFCPYCAAERWALVTALLKFGSFSNLTESHSSSTDTNPDTPTFNFHGATYSSQYVTLTAVETTTNQPQGNFYAPLDTPTAAQQALITKYTQGYIPFVDLGGRFLIKAPQYDGKILAGMTVDQVATAAADPATPVGEAIEASAGTLVPALCQLTGGAPAAVCAAFPSSA